MTPRERVLTAYAHQEPDRVPCWCGASPEFWTKAKAALGLDDEGLRVRLGDDFRRVCPRYVGPELTPSPGCTSRGVFGVERRGVGCGMAANHPLAHATLSAIHAYPWPDPAWMDVSTIAAEARVWQGQYALLGGDWSPFWHDALDLLGTENLLLKLHDAPALVEAVLTHIVDYYFEVNRRLFEAAANALDLFFVGNDFGSVLGPLVSPSQFERFLRPHVRRLADLGHAYGLKVQWHCCGGFEPLIPLLIDAGVDGLHAVQPHCRGMDLARLKAVYGRRLVFNGGIDSQSVLLEGTPDSVRETTRRTLALMAPGGGYVAGPSHDYLLEETPLENVLALFEAVREFGTYDRPLTSQPLR